MAEFVVALGSIMRVGFAVAACAAVTLLALWKAHATTAMTVGAGAVGLALAVVAARRARLAAAGAGAGVALAALARLCWSVVAWLIARSA